MFEPHIRIIGVIYAQKLGSSGHKWDPTLVTNVSFNGQQIDRIRTLCHRDRDFLVIVLSAIFALSRMTINALGVF